MHRSKSPARTTTAAGGGRAASAGSKNTSNNSSSMMSAAKKPPLRPTAGTTAAGRGNRENNSATYHHPHHHPNVSSGGGGNSSSVGGASAAVGASDGYISDVHSQHSAPSEFSEEFYSSTKMLEQHFKDKYKVLRDAYEQRVLQLSDVVTRTCEHLLGDEVLLEMRTDKASSVFIPAHLSEVIQRHLEHEREQFIHKLVTQLSSVKVELLQCQETLVTRDKAVADMEADVARGKRAEAAHDAAQRKLSDAKRQLEEVSSRYEGDTKALKTMVAELTARDREAREEVQRLQKDLAAKEREHLALRAVHDDKMRTTMVLETSFEQVRASLPPLSLPASRFASSRIYTVVCRLLLLTRPSHMDAGGGGGSERPRPTRVRGARRLERRGAGAARQGARPIYTPSPYISSLTSPYLILIARQGAWRGRETNQSEPTP